MPAVRSVCVELRARLRHQPQPRQVSARRQPACHLLVELGPVATRYHRDVRDGQQVGSRVAHPVGTRLLAFGEGPVEIEGDKLFHGVETLRKRLWVGFVEQRDYSPGYLCPVMWDQGK